MRKNRKIAASLAFLFLFATAPCSHQVQAVSLFSALPSSFVKRAKFGLSFSLLNTLSIFVVYRIKNIPLDAPLDFSLPFYNNDTPNLNHIAVHETQEALYSEPMTENRRNLMQLPSSESTNDTFYETNQTEDITISRNDLFGEDLFESNHTYPVKLTLEGPDYYTPFNLFSWKEEVESITYPEFIYQDPFEAPRRRLAQKGKTVHPLEKIASKINFTNPKHLAAFSKVVQKYGEINQIQQDKKMVRLESVLFQIKKKEPLYQYVKEKGLGKGEKRRSMLSKEKEKWIADDKNHEKLTDIQMGVCSCPFCDGGNLTDYIDGFWYAAYRAFFFFSLSVCLYAYFCCFSECLCMGCSKLREQCCKVLCLSYCTMSLLTIRGCIFAALNCENGNCCFPDNLWKGTNPCKWFCLWFDCCSCNIEKVFGNEFEFISNSFVGRFLPGDFNKLGSSNKSIEENREGIGGHTHTAIDMVHADHDEDETAELEVNRITNLSQFIRQNPDQIKGLT
ncbi:MAG: hypothetical protein AAF335_02005 [Bacteroidota bacterium]